MRLIFVALCDHKNFSTAKISRFTVYHCLKATYSCKNTSCVGCVCLNVVLWCITGCTLYHTNNGADCLICTIKFQYSLSHVPVIRFSSLRWDKAVQELMCWQAPLPRAQLALFPSYAPLISPTMLKVIMLASSDCSARKEQNCTHLLCIVSIHECSGRFFTLHLIYWGVIYTVLKDFIIQ